jgi:hypothetical protein
VTWLDFSGIIGMAKRNVEMNDDLDERVKGAIDEVKNALESYLNVNPDINTLPDLANDLDDDGTISEIVDSAVPVYTKDINDLWYLYSREFEEAHFNAGISDNPRENNGMSAIYCYIYDQVYDWYRNEAENYFHELKAKGK